MHFTLWPFVRSNEGGHTEITWPDFLSFLAAPAAVTDIERIEGWSPARFAGNRRSKASVEAVSAIVLDDDKSGLPLERVRAIWSAFAGALHTSRRHTDAAPRYRIVLRCSRDMTPAEHARVWAFARDAAARAGQILDEATKDASRLWFCPAHLPGAPYAWCELEGAALDVDAILSATPAPTTPAPTTPAPTTPAPTTPDARRTAMAFAIGSAWPPKGGGRHEAQLALAGALRAEGFDEGEGVEFLCAVCRVAGDEDRSKREATCRHTWSRPADAPTTGWTRLKSFVDPVVVDAARGALSRKAEIGESVTRRLVEAAARAGATPDTPALADTPAVEPGQLTGAAPFGFKAGGLDADLPPLQFQIDSLFCHGEVLMLVAHGNSLKTWLAFSLALAVSTGRPWLGKFFSTRGRVAILDFESGDYEVRRRLKLLGARDAEIEDRLLRSSYSGADLTDPEAWITLAELRLDMLVIDSFKAASPTTDENDARADLILQHAGRFAEATGCTVLVIHHARKGSSGDERELVRGSTALFAACDRIFKFDEPEKLDNGVVLSTMRSIKDGAGRRPPEVRVELSDQGLRQVEIPKEDERRSEENTTEQNRALVLRQLKNHPSGVAKKTLVDVMKGKREAKFELLGQLELRGLTIEYRQQGRDIVMLRPGVPL